MRRQKKRTFSEVKAGAALWQLGKQPDSPHAKRVFKILELFVAGKYFGELSVLLSRYRWANLIDTDGKPFLQPPPDAHLSDEDFQEYSAVRALLDLAARDGGLKRVRRCLHCRNWFMALKRSDQTFCNEPGRFCRQDFNAEDPRVRENRLARMRERYALLKRLENNPKSGVGLNKRGARQTKKRKSLR